MTTPQEIFKSLAAIPTYSDATILPSSTANTAHIQVSLSQRDLERNVRRKFTRTVVASITEDIPLILSGPSVDTGDAVVQAVSPSGKFTVILRSVAGEKKKHFIEIWSEGAILNLLEATSAHDDFYADSTFGTLEWSNDETKIVYVAERKKSEDAVEASCMHKFTYRPDWGETFTGKREPSLVVVNLDNLEIKVLDRFEGDMSPGQAIFSRDSKSLIFTGYHRDPQFFGVVYCQNRVTGLYQINLDGTGIKLLTGDLKSARSPRLNPEGTTLVFLSNPINGPHASCAKLSKLDIASGVISTVVDYVRKADSKTGFPGLYIDQLPKQIWASSTKIITSSAWRLRRTLLSIDIVSGAIEELTPSSLYPGSTTALSSNSKWVLATYSTPVEPWVLLLGQIDADTKSNIKVHFSTLESSKVEKAKSFYQPHTWSIVDNIPGQLESLEALFLEPFKFNSESQKTSAVSGSRPPLVIFPHGGPHSGFSAEFSVLILVLVGLGFSVACVNFTGSLGYGQDNVEELVGKVGDLDVKQCQAVRDYIISKGQVDADRACLTGGSHGGFIVAHLLADPSYKAAVLRNPVTDIPAMTNVTDINDWCYAVNGLPYDMESPPTSTLKDAEVFRKMRASSPMEHVEKVVAPTLMMLGSGDRRVPPSQGISWWQARQNKINKDQKQKTAVNRIQMFDGTGHALDSVEAESNSTYCLANFLVEFTRIEKQAADDADRPREGGRGASSTGIHSPAISPPPSTSTPRAQPLSGSIASKIGSSSSTNNGKPGLSAFTPGPNSGSGITSANKTHLKNHSTTGQLSQPQQDWSIFATMSNVSTLSSLSYKNNGSLSHGSSLYASSDSIIPPTSPSRSGPNAMSNLRKLPIKLDDIFKTQSTGNVPIDLIEGTDSVCTCTCPQHRRVGSDGRLSLSPSKRRNQKESREAFRGYPTGHCVTTIPPEETTWDEKDAEIPLTQLRSTAKNTAFNLEAMKALLNSPLFSNFLKFLTIIASVSLLSIALDAIVLVKHSVDQESQLTNANAELVVTATLSIMTIAYSCFTIFLESRRPPEGLDSSNSKPLIVIFSEIIASIVWSQVLSVAIYIYIWTYGCTEAGERQIEQTDFVDHNLKGMLCRRQAAMVGLELLLVLLLIFNFYTHLAQNFKFIRAVS
ncbi:hypothetical protein BGX26_009998 [Mortierella sp. AD094]|nr:hypothetical protein BGX26_009998 [Mortierella sp. AD094]